MSVLKAAYLVTAGALAMSLPTAAAQDYFQRDRHTRVQDRQQPEFDPEPIRLGGLLVDSSLGLGITQNDNVFATSTGEQSDTTFSIDPRVYAHTNWSQHEIGALVALQHREFSDLSSENTTDIRTQLSGRLDATRALSFSGSLNADSLHESRTTASSLGGFRDPLAYDVLGGRLEARYKRNRLATRTTLIISDLDYDDAELRSTGAIVDQDFRDHVRRSLQQRVSVAISPDIAVFGQAEVGERDFNTTFDVLGNEINRDSTTYALQGGVDFELPSLFRGDVAVGWLKDNKHGIGFGDISGLAVNANVEWFPSQLTTVTFSTTRQTIDPGLAFSPGATWTRYGVRVDHELRRNIVLYAQASQADTDFEDVVRDDEVLDFGAGGIYKMNKHVHVNAFFAYLDRSSTIPTDEFNQSIFGIRLVFFP